MHNLKYLRHSLLLPVFLFIISSAVFAQHSGRKATSKRDSLRRSILRRDSMLRTFKRSDTSVNSFLQKIEYYNSTFNQVKTNLSRDIDTANISKQLPAFEKRVLLFKKLIDEDQSSTLRYLYTIRDLLTRSDGTLDEWQDKLTSINAKLTQAQNELAQMHKDSMLKVMPTDTALISTFFKQKGEVLRKWRKLDSIDRKLLLKVGLLQNRVTNAYIAILDQTDQVDQKIHDFGIRALSCESSYIWDIASSPDNPFSKALSKTIVMNTKLLSFMLSRDMLLHLCSLILLVLLSAWIYYNRRKVLITKKNPHDILSQTTYIAKYGLASAILVTAVITPNFYNHPPVVFLELVFIILLLSVLYLVKKTEDRLLFNFLHELFWITLLFSASNLFVEVANLDRIAIFLLAILAVWVGLRFHKKLTKSTGSYPPGSVVIIRFFIILQALSVLCNILGRFSLAKIIAVTATYNLWLALGLYYVVQILMESLFLQLEANKNDTGISSYIDFKVLQKKLRNILNIIAVVLWLIMFSQNLSIEDAFFDYVSDLLTQSHSIGGTGSFTFGSIIIFLVVIWLSSIAARIISYIYDFADQHKNTTPLFKKKQRTSILIIKIAIFAIGFLLALAASGVPIDKVTIIISAFGVGIGFGLQNIVNNLVSGLILAFERPVQVGDIIEVDNKSGTITEIGIRSSRIATSDGAELIVPNGDLISHHVINWTLSNNNRRVELVIGVAYGSDVEQVKSLLKEILEQREDIMTSPAPAVFLHNLSENSVDFRVLFWAADIGTWLELKSKILTDVYKRLNAAGIGLPFPQREVYVHMANNESDKKE